MDDRMHDESLAELPPPEDRADTTGLREAVTLCATRPVDEDLLLGRVVQGYRIERRLGAGGMAVVYQATQLRLGRKVALKLLPPVTAALEVEFRARFEREAKLLAGLDHPHLLAVHDFFEEDGLFCIATSYAAGGSLHELIQREGPLPEKHALRILREVASGLGAAHRRGIVHRDIKPGNILLDSELRARLADFGIARGKSSRPLTEAGQVIGTSAYMAPELWEGTAADRRSDLYALGCVAYEMLVGAPPFRGPSSANFAKQHMLEAAVALRQLRPALSPRTERVVAILLAKEPSARFTDADALLAALDGEATRPGPKRARRRDPLSIAIVAGLVLLVVLLGFRFVLDLGRVGDGPPEVPTEPATVRLPFSQINALARAASRDISAEYLSPTGLHYLPCPDSDRAVTPGSYSFRFHREDHETREIQLSIEPDGTTNPSMGELQIWLRNW